MGKDKIWPSLTPKPLNLSPPTFVQVITSWTSITMQNFIQIGQGISFLRMRDFAHQIVYSAIRSFWGVVQIAYIQND